MEKERGEIKSQMNSSAQDQTKFYQQRVAKMKADLEEEKKTLAESQKTISDNEVLIEDGEKSLRSLQS